MKDVSPFPTHQISDCPAKAVHTWLQSHLGAASDDAVGLVTHVNTTASPALVALVALIV